MDRGTGQTTTEYIEIHHPWISNDLMPIYRWTFPSEATNEELSACLRAREDWALRALVTAVFWISSPKFPNQLFSEPLEAESWAKRQLAAKLAELA